MIAVEHVTHVRIYATAFAIGSTRYVAECECGWIGRPRLVNPPGRRAALREAALHLQRNEDEGDEP